MIRIKPLGTIVKTVVIRKKNPVWGRFSGLRFGLAPPPLPTAIEYKSDGTPVPFEPTPIGAGGTVQISVSDANDYLTPVVTEYPTGDASRGFPPGTVVTRHLDTERIALPTGYVPPGDLPADMPRYKPIDSLWTSFIKEKLLIPSPPVIPSPPPPPVIPSPPPPPVIGFEPWLMTPPNEPMPAIPDELKNAYQSPDALITVGEPLGQPPGGIVNTNGNTVQITNGNAADAQSWSKKMESRLKRESQLRTIMPIIAKLIGADIPPVLTPYLPGDTVNQEPVAKIPYVFSSEADPLKNNQGILSSYTTDNLIRNWPSGGTYTKVTADSGRMFAVRDNGQIIELERPVPQSNVMSDWFENRRFSGIQAKRVPLTVTSKRFSGIIARRIR